MRPSAAAASASEVAPPANGLNVELPPVGGSTILKAGFAPDPFAQPITSGGPIDVSATLGGGCMGWATAAPSIGVTYEAGSMTLLRFYFVAASAGADTTLVVNAPDGSWHCNDDSPGGIDPMIDFGTPQAGPYAIWVGSFEEGTAHDGTLHVTELASNTP